MTESSNPPAIYNTTVVTSVAFINILVAIIFFLKRALNTDSSPMPSNMRIILGVLFFTAILFSYSGLMSYAKMAESYSNFTSSIECVVYVFGMFFFILSATLVIFN